jgi:hypothetical protein
MKDWSPAGELYERRGRITRITDDYRPYMWMYRAVKRNNMGQS